MAQGVILEAYVKYDEFDESIPEAKFGSPASSETRRLADLYKSLTSTTNDNAPTDQLCENCKTLPWTRSDFVTKSNETRYFPLGLYADISTRQCALCQLAASVLQLDVRTGSEGVDLSALGACRLELQDLRDWTEYQSYGDLPVVKVLAERSTGDSENEVRSHNSIDLFCEPGEPEFYLGRCYPESQLALETIQTWLRCCDEWHQGECKKSFRSDIPHPATQMTVYAIDVTDLKLVQLREVDRYCALSYVWGDCKQYLLSKAYLEDLKQDKGLAPVLDQIPLTIRDSIDLVRDLGLRYLWVDSICLIQDDAEYKIKAIRNMDTIYANAHLTIVAASGKDASDGLAGYRAGTRGSTQTLATIGNPKYTVGVIPKFQSTFYYSNYSQRAWTYQEVCFSNRCLIFLEGRAIFQCQNSLWREDFTAEDPGVRCQLQELNSHFTSRRSLLMQYRIVLHEYSRRKLTYRSDTLNAFAAFLKYQKVLMSIGEPVCGMHPSLLDWLLLWRSSRGTKRDKNFPSWSWAGWLGEANLPRPLTEKVWEQWAMNHLCAEFTFHPVLDLGYVTRPNILECESVVAVYRLYSQIDQPDFINPLFSLSDERGVVCGYAQIHDFVDCAGLYRLAQGVTAVVLSDVQDLLQTQFPTLDGKLDYDPDSVPDTSEHPQAAALLAQNPTRWPQMSCTGHEDDKWDNGASQDGSYTFYNVMLAVPRAYVTPSGLKSETGGPVQGQSLFLNERIGVGVIHKKALQWAKAPGPIKGKIWLQ